MAVLSLRAARLGLLLGGLVLTFAPAAAQSPAPGNLIPDAESGIINKHLARTWQTEGVKPSERCTEPEFVRRASLDIIGRIATLEEATQFMSDVKRLGSSPARTILIDRLLASEEYKTNWSTLWTHWLMTRTGEVIYREQIKLWLYEQFADPNHSIKEMAIRLIAATGKSNDNGAVNYILAHLGAPNPPQDQARLGQFDMVPVTARTFRLFLGYQIQCAQCHDHPSNPDWKQHHFWNTNIWFRQTVREGQPMPRNPNNQMAVQQVALTDNPAFNPTGRITFENRRAVLRPAVLAFYDGTRLPKSEGQAINRREELAKFVTNHTNFPKAFINRTWGHFFNRGLGRLAAYDDFGEHNEIVHEELMTELSAALIKANYNPRKLIRWICNSEPYQLSAMSNKTNGTVDAEKLMSRYPLKAMSPEQLLESLIVATRPEEAGTAAERDKFRADFMAKLVIGYGSDAGDEGNLTATVTAKLLLVNGAEINRLITRSRAVKHALALKNGKEALDHLFLAAFNRRVDPKESRQVLSQLELSRGRIKDTDPAGPAQDLFWALLNSSEFFLNH